MNTITLSGQDRNKTKFVTYGSQWLQFGYEHSLKYLLVCSNEERNSYRFGTT